MSEESETEYEDDLPESPSQKIKLKRKRYLLSTKQFHCETERKRRERILSLTLKLKNTIPSYLYANRKTDKLSVLKIAANAIKCIENERSAENNISTILTNQELEYLSLKAINGFLLIVGCDSGYIKYVTKSVETLLNCSQEDWIGFCIFDKIHCEDLEKFRDQLSTEELEKPEWLTEMKSQCSKRQKQKTSKFFKKDFICRLKMGSTSDSNENRTDTEKYLAIHFTGFIKESICGQKLTYDHSEHLLTENMYTEYLVAVGRIQLNAAPKAASESETEFLSRCSLDGTFIFIDQRIKGILGYSSNELLNKSCYDFIHPDDQDHVKESFQQVIILKGQHMSIVSRFSTNNNGWISLRMSMYAFLNPWSNITEYVICKNSLIKSYIRTEKLIPESTPVLHLNNERNCQQNFSCVPHNFELIPNTSETQNICVQNPSSDFTNQSGSYDYLTSDLQNINQNPTPQTSSDFPEQSTSDIGKDLHEEFLEFSDLFSKPEESTNNDTSVKQNFPAENEFLWDWDSIDKTLEEILKENPPKEETKPLEIAQEQSSENTLSDLMQIINKSKPTIFEDLIILNE